MKFAIVVQGRFWAFDLARTLVARGHEVTVFTNYPARVAGGFGIKPANIETNLPHGILSRALGRVARLTGWNGAEALMHRWFGTWAARRVRDGEFDIVHCWSGVSEEILRRRPARGARYMMARGSSHIIAQKRILAQEAAITGTRVEQPSDWMIRRELREYSLADSIQVLSSFCRDTFTEHGVPADRVVTCGVALEATGFNPEPGSAEERRRRVLSGAPLRVLYVGTVCLRKGIRDLASVVEALPSDQFEFRCVGTIAPDARESVARLRGRCEITGHRPQRSLPESYRWADVFFFPTLEDGFPAVLAQAHTSGLPILTTTNCSASDFIEDGLDGWILPVHDVAGFIARLRWCAANRESLVSMMEAVTARPLRRTWDDAAAEFEQLCDELVHGRVDPERLAGAAR